MKEYVVKVLGELGLGYDEDHYHKLDVVTREDGTICKVCSNDDIIFLIPADRFELLEVEEKDGSNNGQ